MQIKIAIMIMKTMKILSKEAELRSTYCMYLLLSSEIHLCSLPVRLRPPLDPLEVGLVDDADADGADEVRTQHRSHHLVREVGDLAYLGILKINSL